MKGDRRGGIRMPRVVNSMDLFGGLELSSFGRGEGRKGIAATDSDDNSSR